MIQKPFFTDFLIVGGGIVGLCIARTLRIRFPQKRIVILEKEKFLGLHASGRNSGVLHAGFYYASDSLKAHFTLEGNRAWKKYCIEKNLPLNQNGKLVVASHPQEIKGLHTLYERGLKNRIPLQLISAREMLDIEPNAQTCEYALYSPETATISPEVIIETLTQELIAQGVEIFTNEAFVKKHSDGIILSSQNRLWEAAKLINTAGLYADVVAKQFGFAQKYRIMPFKGLYLKNTGKDQPVKVNIYPVPDLNFPFLGVHLTVTATNQVKLGPTAIPAFWRENYEGFSQFHWSEFAEVVSCQLKLFLTNAFNFRKHALMEMKKFYKPYFVAQAQHLVKNLHVQDFTQWTRPGIRAQLMNIQTQQLVQDFVVEANEKSVHVLNAVSPAFTCALPFSQWIVEQYIE